MRRLYLSKTDSKIAGICGGIVCLVTAVMPVVITYIVGWIVIPERPPDERPLD
ncbi:MAG: PspC domain-containing protein [Planctomycetota bacterium]|jgi:phage shock protein PspC (stress-responsive transcriptional regulator)